MRGFILLTSILALALGFLGAALGLQPRPVQGSSPDVAERTEALERRLEDVRQALATLERRFEDHLARTPAIAAEPAATPPPPSPDADAAAAEDEPRPDGADRPEATAEPVTAPAARSGADLLLAAALERAEEHLAAGDAGGARDLFLGVLERDGLPLAIRARASHGVASSWAIVGETERARAGWTALLETIDDVEDPALADLARTVRERLRPREEPR